MSMIGLVCRSATAMALLLNMGAAFAAQPALTSVTYVCDSGQTVIVHYDDSNAEAQSARLDYLGKSFEMYNVRTETGRRFATEQGLTPDRGLQWITTDEGAVLSEMLMDHTAPQPTAIENCKPKA